MYSLTQQIQAIMKARMLVIKEATSIHTREDLRVAYNEISEGLNDAGSTIANLNLTKDTAMIEKECKEDLK